MTDKPSVTLPLGVGKTSLLISAARAEAQKMSDRPFEDPLAALLSSPAYDAQEDKYPIIENYGAWCIGSYHGFVVNIAIRTMWYDRQVVSAAEKGVRQFVNLGAGMDTRPFRISQLEATETTWFEVDFPAVTEYKNTMLASANAQPKCARHCVVANLTQKGWTAELEKKGFDPKAPTLWMVEGLTMYLDEEENKSLHSEILSASAPGSAMAVLWCDQDWVDAQAAPTSPWKLEDIHMKYGTSDPARIFKDCGWGVSEVSLYTQLCETLKRPDLLDPASKLNMIFALGIKE